MLRYLNGLSGVRPLSELAPIAAGLVDLSERCLADTPEVAVARVHADALLRHWWCQRNGGDLAEALRTEATIHRTAAAWDAVAPVAGAMVAKLADCVDPRERYSFATNTLDRRYRLPPTGRFLAAWKRVEACAMAGDTERLKAAAATALEAHATVTPDDDRDGFVLASLPRMDAGHLVMSRLTVRLLADGPDVAEEYESALAGFPRERVRDAVYFRGVLGVARAVAGDLDGALADAETSALLARDTGAVLPLVSAGLFTVARRRHLAPIDTVLADCGMTATA